MAPSRSAMFSSKARAGILSLLAAAALAACAPIAQKKPAEGQVPQMSEGELRDKALASLARGIQQYDAGNYVEASRSLDAALDHGQLTRSEQGRARKYLAFVDCVSGREARCKDQFRKALEIDPGFELSVAEAGHPIWGPAYRDVRAQLAAEAAAAAAPPKPAPRTGAEGLLDEGLEKYNAGSYEAAARLFEAAFKKGLAEKADRVRALKYSAFSRCLIGHRISCRSEFAKIFRIDPAFDLAPAEAGHPSWSKTFAETKRRAQKKR